MSSNHCSLCSELNGEAVPHHDSAYAELIKERRNILYRSTQFSVIPSIGALNPSHALIVSNGHDLSIASIPTKSRDHELSHLFSAIELRCLETVGKPVIFFEHGSGDTIDFSGSCVSHAHIHAIVGDQRFITNMLQASHFAKLEQLKDSFLVANRETGYLWMRTSSNSNWVSNYPEIPKQLFRRIYAENVGLPEGRHWNWRIDPQPEATIKVIEFYKDVWPAA